MPDLFDLIGDEFDRLLRRVRKGFYIARVTHAEQSYRRVQAVPDWLADGALDNLRRIASPIMDVIPAVDARMAVISQDGVPELGAVLGQIWDDLTAPMTVWLRANLAESPGHLEVGAQSGIRIRVGESASDGKAAVEIDETADGEIIIESDAGNCRIRIQADGTVVVDASRVELSGSTSALARADRVGVELTAIKGALDTIATAAGAANPYLPGSTGADNVFGE